MKMQIISLLLMLGISLHANIIEAQFHLGTYSFAALGIGGPVTNRLDLEGKLFANARIDDLAFEGLVMFDLRPGSFHQFSAGGGFNVNLFEGNSDVSLLIPVELEIYPLASFR